MERRGCDVHKRAVVIETWMVPVLRFTGFAGVGNSVVLTAARLRRYVPLCTLIEEARVL